MTDHSHSTHDAQDDPRNEAIKIYVNGELVPKHQAVVSVSGDGGFLYNGQEMATAVQYGIGVVAIVFNDNAYGNVKRTQIQRYGGSVIASDLQNPDFVRLAESFGAAGYLAETADELKTAIGKGFGENGPVLIEVPVGHYEMPNPWRMMMLPPVMVSLPFKILLFVLVDGWYLIVRSLVGSFA